MYIYVKWRCIVDYVFCVYFSKTNRLSLRFIWILDLPQTHLKTIQANTPSHPIFYIDSDHRTKLQKQICWQFLNIIWILCRKAHFRPRHINRTTPFWFWETTMSAPHHHHHHHQLQTLSQFHPFIHLSYLFCRGVGKSLSCYVAFSLIKCCWKLSTFPWCYPSPCVLLLVPFFMVLRKQQRFSSIWVSANWIMTRNHS